MYASYLILGNTGVGKTHFVNTIFNSVNCPFYTELKTIDFPLILICNNEFKENKLQPPTRANIIDSFYMTFH